MESGKRISPIGIQPASRRVFCTIWALSLLPWLPLVILHAFAWFASTKLGHWPIYLVDDPDSLQMDHLYFLTLLTIVALPVGWLTSTGVLVAGLAGSNATTLPWRKNPWVTWAGLHGFTAGLLVLLLLRWDPFHAVCWFFD